MRWDSRQARFLWITTGVVVIVLLLFLLRAALFPFVLGVALAYVLHPYVAFMERVNPWRQRWPAMARVSAILLIYIVVIGFIVLVSFVIIPPAFDEASGFVLAIP
ncbi:MAG: hypothetical protein ACREGD_05200, partial [Candidatus Saccharimonadales bacterium]